MAGFLRPGVVGATVESFPLFRCPKCGGTGTIDLEQFLGMVSVECTHEGCGYHETHDWRAEPSGVG